MNKASELKELFQKDLIHRLIYDWILVPLGICVILSVVILLNQLFKVIGFNFPANVAGMLIVSVILIVCQKVLKESTMNTILKWINPAVEFLMNWMVLFFLPPLISIVNSKNLPNGGDIIKLIIVFFLGLILFIPLVGFFIHYVSSLYTKLKKIIFKKDTVKEYYGESNVNTLKEENLNLESNTTTTTTTITTTTNNSNNNDDKDEIDKDKISNDRNGNEEIIDIKDESDITSQKPSLKTKEMDKDSCSVTATSNHQKKQKFKWKSTAIPSRYCVITYLIIYAVSWIPAALWNFTQPLHIAVNVLSLFISLCVPDKIRMIFHPLIGCTVFSYGLLWIEGIIFGRSLKDEISLYSNEVKYLSYLNDTSLPFPRAGELLFIFLDAIVVAFSFRILEHHQLIIHHIVELVGSIWVMSFLSMLTHITLSRLFGISPIYALSMASRSDTNPLAVQVVNYLHSDMAIAILLVAFTGIFVAIIGLPLLKMVHFPLKDSLAHGACMGCAGHAMATASLLKDFPSASAVSSISFVLFSTFCVIWSAIPPVANLFRSVAGL
ncbi:hypothetical protein BCR36DRAFT_408601 [Piromyces finnis]|uniref:LrgB-domain-containing protein n=1 Tax=Piromyces finnis TaxID=1754191 RepID=A0A1Y1VKS3_9FUNG|nr:hypothetical protein BCR36DRAFT_408601 [Piromyces finnis]|eukprot:ORX59069.1 hypothetical protein BCR36DRAFT_408601 [Piromyces finnis]